MVVACALWLALLGPSCQMTSGSLSVWAASGQSDAYHVQFASVDYGTRLYVGYISLPYGTSGHGGPEIGYRGEIPLGPARIVYHVAGIADTMVGAGYDWALGLRVGSFEIGQRVICLAPHGDTSCALTWPGSYVSADIGL